MARRALKSVEELREAGRIRQARYQEKRRRERGEAERNRSPVDLDQVITGELGDTKRHRVRPEPSAIEIDL